VRKIVRTDRGGALSEQGDLPGFASTVHRWRRRLRIRRHAAEVLKQQAYCFVRFDEFDFLDIPAIIICCYFIYMFLKIFSCFRRFFLCPPEGVAECRSSVRLSWLLSVIWLTPLKARLAK
jgi:hypothetical protein